MSRNISPITNWAPTTRLKDFNCQDMKSRFCQLTYLHQQKLTHASIEQQVRHNVQLVKSSPFVREGLKSKTKGFIFDLKTGKLNSVD